MWAWTETEGPAGSVMDKRYIKFFDGYRIAYGLADFEHEEAKVDPRKRKEGSQYIDGTMNPLQRPFIKLI